MEAAVFSVLWFSANAAVLIRPELGTQTQLENWMEKFLCVWLINAHVSCEVPQRAYC